MGENVCCSIQVVYEDESRIKEECISKTETLFTPKDDEFQAKIGPFQFTVCSYKHDGKRFRLKVVLVQNGKEIVSLLSPTLTIKAKKPISKPGTKKRKKEKELIKIPNPIVTKPYPILKPNFILPSNSLAIQQQPVILNNFEEAKLNFNQFFEEDKFESILNIFDIMNEDERKITLDSLEFKEHLL